MMANQFDYECPKCGDCDSLDIEATVFVRLTEDGTDLDLSRNGDHEWSDDSFATCGCGWDGKVSDLSPEGCATCAASIETRVGLCDECGHNDEDDSPDEIDCGQCEGTGETDAMGEREQCPVCDGTGKIEEED